MPIFCVKSVKIYTGQKKFTRVYLWLPRQIWGMTNPSCTWFSFLQPRWVSLKFLAWHFLNTRIQGVTHDSTEDAVTSLRLYRKHLELKKEGKVDDDFFSHNFRHRLRYVQVMEALTKMYDLGKELNWKIPDPWSVHNLKVFCFAWVKIYCFTPQWWSLFVERTHFWESQGSIVCRNLDHNSTTSPCDQNSTLTLWYDVTSVLHRSCSTTA